ncbi:MAG: hypothetical protein RL150_147 [Candidatus Parcubacteria bacterium]|jgi:hypothetical protein
MKIAVIGAGLFGTTTAVHLARNGFDVTLFEKEGGILRAASGINQYRLHRGYHYPRSKETADSARASEQSFQDMYGDALIDDVTHFYCIAKEDSKVSGKEMLMFCDSCNLEYVHEMPAGIRSDAIDLSIRVRESLINHERLKSLIEDQLQVRGVKQIFNTEVTVGMLTDYDIVVNCTYANLNRVLDALPDSQQLYQFEICEKPVLQLPTTFKKQSIVIMDGPFMCIDPYADTPFHVMGNVVHAIHASNVGLHPIVPEALIPFLNKGVIKNPSVTNIDYFIESASHFMPSITEAKHIGSMYTIRTVLADVDATDERPTLVRRVGDNVINVFSGKLGTSVDAAHQVLALVKEMTS